MITLSDEDKATIAAGALGIRDALLAYEADPRPRNLLILHNRLNKAACDLEDLASADRGTFGGTVHTDGGTDKPPGN